MKTHVFQSAETNKFRVFSCELGSAFSMFLYARILQKNVEKGQRKSIKNDEKTGPVKRPEKVSQKVSKKSSKSSSKID